MYSCILTKNVDAYNTTSRDGRKIGIIKAGSKVRGNAPSNGWVQLDWTISSKGKSYRQVYVKEKHLPGYKQEVTAPPVTPPPGPVQAFYFVKHQWQRDDAKEYAGRKNLPMVFRMGDAENTKNSHFVTLTREWQFFWYDLCCLVVYGQVHGQLSKEANLYLSKRWAAVGTSERAFDNGHGLDIYRNYVTGENMDTKEDPALATIITSGASLSGFETGGLLCVQHFDGNQPPPDVRTINPHKDPRVFFATTGSDYHVGPFPQFGGLDVPVPIIAYRDIFFPLHDLERYTASTKRRPYYP